MRTRLLRSAIFLETRSTMSAAAPDSPASAPTPPPRFATALAAGAGAGLSVDLLFYPIDTLKTRLQAAQGFWAAGGLRGIYKGVSSVALGSAPGGTCASPFSLSPRVPPACPRPCPCWR